MQVVLLTGSLASGKSTLAKMARRLGFWVFDADACVHRLYEGPAVRLIGEAFPSAVVNEKIDRRKLFKELLDKPGAFDRLQNLVLPLVYWEEKRFLLKARRAGIRRVLVDSPIGLEIKADRRSDIVFLAEAPEVLLKTRALNRPGMTLEKYTALKARQLPRPDKRKRADFVIPTGLGLAFSQRVLVRALRQSRDQKGRKYPWAYAPLLVR